jgi:hypothetical protein
MNDRVDDFEPKDYISARAENSIPADLVVRRLIR